jgi:tripeptidyl-peptidase-1
LTADKKEKSIVNLELRRYSAVTLPSYCFLLKSTIASRSLISPVSSITMVHFSTLLTASVALTSSAFALSIPLDAKYTVHEKREAHRDAFNFAKRDVLGSNAIIPIRIGLTQRDLHRGYDWLMSVAHPESPSYGKHWSAAEVNKAFAPTAETVTMVREWLIRAGIAEHRITMADNKGWLAFDAQVEEAEELFRARYYMHEAGRGGKYSVGCDE